MSDDDLRNKKTLKEGLTAEQREELERAKAKRTSESGVAAEKRESASKIPPAPFSERDAAILADRHSSHDGVFAAEGTPHGKEDVASDAKPVPRADSDDEAPLQTYKKIDQHDRE